MSCVRRFLLSNITEPACMSCRVQFGYEFLIETLPQTFWNHEYKDFRKTLLLGREEAYLPDTQACVMRIQLARGFRKYVESYRKKVQRMQRICDQLARRSLDMDALIYEDRMGTHEIPEDDPRFRDFTPEGTPLMNDQKEFLCLLRRAGGGDEGPTSSRSRSAHPNAWVIACPDETCRGYLRGEQDRCVLCRTLVCTGCMRILSDDTDATDPTTIHACSDDDRKTLELLKTNTRSCPSCHIPIYKISGCDQMWCVQCHTAFSWRTGMVINQTIHNPHYYEWVRRTRSDEEETPGRGMPRNLLDIPCGGLPGARRISRAFPDDSNVWAMHLHQMITHTENHTIPRYTRQCTLNEGRKELRVMYLCKQLSREQWQAELYHREKAVEKYRRYIQILQTFVTVGSEWFREVVIFLDAGTPPPTRNSDAFKSLPQRITEFSDFWGYINSQIHTLNRRFKSHLASLPMLP